MSTVFFDFLLVISHKLSGCALGQICSICLLTKLLAGCIMEISSARAVGARPSIPQIGAFVNRQNRQKKSPKFGRFFNYYFLTVMLKIERRSAIMSQMTNASFHENTMAKEPMDTMPIIGRSQQRSQTSPAVNRNEMPRAITVIRIVIIFILLS